LQVHKVHKEPLERLERQDIPQAIPRTIGTTTPQRQIQVLVTFVPTQQYLGMLLICMYLLWIQLELETLDFYN
jgi:hypothetical protein